MGKNFNKMKKIDRKKLRHENRPKTVEKDGNESQVMFNAQAENIGVFYSYLKNLEANIEESSLAPQQEFINFSAEQIVVKYDKFKIQDKYWTLPEIMHKQEAILGIFLDRYDIPKGLLNIKNAEGWLIFKIPFSPPELQSKFLI